MTESGVEQLEPGSVLRRGDSLFIVEWGPSNSGDVVVGELGDRRLKPEQVPEIGDDCPNPACDGVVEDWDRLGKRFCSEGCLEWLTCFKDDGQDCDKYAAHDCDGTIVHEDAPSGQYRYSCTECDSRGGGAKRWREAWWPNAKEETLEKLDSDEEEDESTATTSTGTERAENTDESDNSVNGENQ